MYLHTYFGNYLLTYLHTITDNNWQ